MITAFGRIGGHVVGFLANNSAVASGQIDIGAARKGTRFVRFCNLYNIPMVFLEDTTGFLPGKDQEHNGIVLEGRRLLDSIIDLRTPRLTLIIRNAFGGAYATFNSHFVGADLVFALPTARIAVMGPAGKEYVYKDEFTAIHRDYTRAVAGGTPEAEAAKEREQRLAALGQRYERELMNPKEALSLGSVSRIVLPGESRQVHRAEPDVSDEQVPAVADGGRSEGVRVRCWTGTWSPPVFTNRPRAGFAACPWSPSSA